MSLRPSERLTAMALAVLLALACLARPPGWGATALALAGLLLAQLLLSGAAAEGGLALVRDFAPAGAVLAIFLLLQPLVAGVNPQRFDVPLAQIDARWLGGVADHWRNSFGRPAAFTDLVYGAYASFYFLPLSVSVLARMRLDAARFERIVFTLLLGFYLSFLGYFLWPAEGPRIPPALEAAQLGGGSFSEGVRTFLRHAERTTLDAFPSGHTLLSLLAVLLAARPFPQLAPLLAVWAGGIIFAAVYISAHYVVDVVAGAALAPLTLLLAPHAARLLGELPPRD
jgi:membrane-associated phospholipid phosphatase